MNLLDHPELLEQLASSYALGTLRGGARRRFEAMARTQAPVRAAALIWQSRLSSLNELQVPAQPSPAVWGRIEHVLNGELQPAARRIRPGAATPWRGWLRSVALWRLGTAAGALATVVVVVSGMTLRSQLGAEIAGLQTQLQSATHIEYVAVLSDSESNASMLVTFDPGKQSLSLQRVGSYHEAADRSLQLWALSAAGKPKSMGVLSSAQVLRLSAGENEVRQVPMLAISLEPKGGVPSETGPTGPVLFKGALIQKML